jgi:para-nitrobenzyl esterase
VQPSCPTHQNVLAYISPMLIFGNLRLRMNRKDAITKEGIDMSVKPSDLSTKPTARRFIVQLRSRAIAVAMAAALVLIAPAGLFSQEGPVVEVTGGQVRGSLQMAPRSGAVFRGIPFAQPPVGDLRWREPQPVRPWRGVRDANQYSAACIQDPIQTGNRRLASLYGIDDEPTEMVRTISEDCLYLNIWVPEWPVKELKPIMLYLYGGANVVGSGADYDGGALATHGVIVVTINYRLGALGFFSHPELTKESPHHASGNYGLLDQVAALQWVQENIARFGGDRSRVTIFGQSSGSRDARLLMSSPLTKGLFQRVIKESESIGPFGVQTVDESEEFGEKVAKILKVPSDGSAIKRMRELRPADILNASAEASKHAALEVQWSSGPRGSVPGALAIVIDGWVLQQNPDEVFAAGKQQPVALMIGNNGREASSGSPWGGAPLASDREGLKKAMQGAYGSLAPKAIALYGVDASADTVAAADQWQNDYFYACPAAVIATLNSVGGQPSFLYQFLRSVPGKDGQYVLGSFHSLELRYVFKTFDEPVSGRLPFQPEDYMLSEFMERYWTNFAKTGSPNSRDLPYWSAFRKDSEAYMEFSQDGRAIPRNGLRSPYCELYQENIKKRVAAQ